MCVLLQQQHRVRGAGGDLSYRKFRKLIQHFRFRDAGPGYCVKAKLSVTVVTENVHRTVPIQGQRVLPSSLNANDGVLMRQRGD